MEIDFLEGHVAPYSISLNAATLQNIADETRFARLFVSSLVSGTAFEALKTCKLLKTKSMSG